MIHSKKGFNIVPMVTVIIVVIIVAALVSQFWSPGEGIMNYLKEKAGIDVEKEQSGSAASQKPMLADKISLRSAAVNGESIHTESYSSSQDGMTSEVSCSSSCALTLTYDRKIKNISDNDYFLILELMDYTNWKLAEGITITLKGNKNEVLITGFEGGNTYFVRMFNFVDYIEDGTNTKYKLNSDHTVLRFETS